MAAALDWNDLRIALAVGEHRNLTRAARALGTSQPTASRRLAALEDALGTKLFLRTSSGLVPTAAGERLVATLEGVGREVARVGEIAVDETRIEGTVRVSVTDVTALHLLEDAIPQLAAEHPALVVELVISPRTADLARREADLAVRLVKPEGGTLVARGLGQMRYGLYASARYLARHGTPAAPTALSGHAIVEPSGELAQGPEALFLREHAAGARVALRTNAMLPMAHAAASGIGLAVLPAPLAASVPGLVLVARITAIRARTIHLVAHRDARRTPRLRVVLDAIERHLRARLARS